jgi:hypothetical protein
MSPRKRRGPALGSQPSYTHNSTATVTPEGLSVYPSRHWYPYIEDQFGDVVEPDEAALISVNRRAPHLCEGCSASLYERAA